MKNTLFFNDSFSPILLENEETETDELRNAIFLRFRTSAATNQKLYITVRNAEYNVDLEPSTDYDYRLEGTYWAPGGITKLQLKNDELVSVFTQITFPEIISTDAALLEESAYNNAYYLQGKEDKDEELRQQVITYTNGVEYNVQSDLTLPKIIEIKFSSVLANTQALFSATINLAASQIEDTGDVTFRIRVNRVMDEVFIPVQTVRNGRYIVTISYPITNVSQNDRNEINVYMTTSTGNIQIEQGQIRASVTASGLSRSEAFTGDIDWTELLGTIEVPQAYSVIIPVEDTAAVTVNSNGLPASFSEIIGPAVLQGSHVTIAPIEEEPSIGRMVLYFTINTENAGQYSYSRAYISIQSDEFSLNESYPFLSQAETIDSGSMKVCNVETSTMDFASIEGLRVVADGENAQAELPSIYQQVDYIESTGGQYIDTGFKPGFNTKVIVDVEVSTAASGNCLLFGSRDAYGSRMFETGWNTSKEMSNDYGAYREFTQTNYSGRLLVERDKEKLKVNGTQVSAVSGASNFTAPVNMTIFCWNQTAGTIASGGFKMYSCKIYDNNVLIRDFIPCYKKAEGTIGMYDLIGETFYSNSGSGVFVKGQDVSQYMTLITDGTDLYSISGGSLTASIGLLSNLSASTFMAYGFEQLSECTDAEDDILALVDFGILRWCQDGGDTSSMTATVTAIPNAQSVITPSLSLTDSNISGIELVTTETSGNPRASIKFDDGPWEYYDTSDGDWFEEGHGTRGYMTVADLENLSEQIWSDKLIGVDEMQTKFTLPSRNDKVTEIQYKFLNE